VKENHPPRQIPILPLISSDQMERILSTRRSISSEAYQEIEAHLGRPLSPGRRKASVNGQTVWVCC